MNPRDDTRHEAGCPVCGSALTEGRWCASCALGEVLADQADGAEPGRFAVPGHAVHEELGRGAAGIVYRARQEQPAREVALKIMRPHEASSAEARTRFRHEAATVARLDHPAILPVLSVGEHDGLPYFTMKLCAGGSLAQRLEHYRTQPRATAALVAALAEAVHHAHQRGVLHRDLKPGNILFDEEDRPFVCDFGLAKSARETGAPVTRPLVVMGTRGYVAPEVLRGGAAAATLAADVFGLGAILHELLAGAPPEENVTTGPGGTLAHAPRDLAVITAKCLAPEPAARYASALALADDLHAWLEGRPVAARPVSALGQAWAWARRNPALAGVSAAALVALVAVAAVSTVAAIRLDREQRATFAALAQVEAERQRVSTESATSQAIADFLQKDLLGQASPDRQADRDLRLRTVLDRAAKSVGGRFATRPLVEAALRETLGSTYGSLGDYAAMQLHLQRALDLRTPLEGPTSAKVLKTKRGLADALLRRGKLPEAEPLARAAYEGMVATLGPEHATTIDSVSILSEICEGLGRSDEAQRLTEQVLEISRRTLGPEHYATLTAMHDLASLLNRRGRTPEAEKLFRETLELRRKVLGPEHPATFVTMSNFAGLTLHQNHPIEAEALYAELAERETRVLGTDHPYTLTARGGLALAWQANGKFAAAVDLQQQVLAIRTRIFGADNASTLNSITNLASALVDAGRYDEAEKQYRTLHAARLRAGQPDDPAALSAAASLGNVLRLRGKLAEAQALQEETLAARERTLGPEHRDTLASMGALGLVHQLRGHTAEAEAWLARRLEISRRTLGDRHSGTLRALDRLGAHRLAAGRLAEAEPLLRESLAARHEAAPDGWATAATRSLLGAALAGLGKFPEAEPLLCDGFTALAAQAAKIPAPDHAEVRDAGARLVEFYASRGRAAEAALWRQKAAEAEAALKP